MKRTATELLSDYLADLAHDDRASAWRNLDRIRAAAKISDDMPDVDEALDSYLRGAAIIHDPEINAETLRKAGCRQPLTEEECHQLRALADRLEGKS